MESTLLTEHESACRAAHEQVQLLQHLYDHLLGKRSRRDLADFDVPLRKRQLERDRSMLLRKLNKLGLLRTEPDPEKEGLLELVTAVKRTFTAADESAVSGRLMAEECELLRLVELLSSHDHDEALAETVARARTAIDSLSGVSA